MQALIPRPLLLASTSTYRRMLLDRLRLEYRVQAPQVDETPAPGESPRDTALRLALAKAQVVAQENPECVVIGSDQVADLQGQTLGKPGTHARAVQQLQRMRANTVLFHTAVAVVCVQSGFCQQAMASVTVRFRDLSDAEIETYLQLEQPYDCAGSAKSEGLGIALLESITSDDPTALIGLPLIRTCALLRAAGIHPLSMGGTPMSTTDPGATLYLVPAPLDFGCAEPAPLERALPTDTLRTAATLKHWICENAKSTRAYLKRISALHPLCEPLQSMQMIELPRHVHKKGDHLGEFDARPLLQAALQGHNMGLVSEAGMPAVADPGSSVVRAAHQLGLRVVPLVGPVSLLLALAASGMNGQHFAFVGYLPSEPGPRRQKIQALEALALQTGQTQLFIETPYRNTALLGALVQTLQNNTRLATASGLTLEHACCHSDAVHHWKQRDWTLDNGTPAVFAIGR